MATTPPIAAPRRVFVGFREATYVEWLSSTLVLKSSEVGRAKDTGEVKFGDGLHTWADLPDYLLSGPDPNAPVDESFPDLVAISQAAMM